jgi:hypothetical protein
MEPDSHSQPVIVPENLICGCGEPMKLNRDRQLPPIGCARCNSEANIDDPNERRDVIRLLRQYWLDHGRRDFAGLDEQP